MCYNNTVSNSEHNTRVQLAGKIISLAKELYDIQLDLDIEAEDAKISEIESTLAELKFLNIPSSHDSEEDYLRQEFEKCSSAKYVSYLINVEGLTVEMALKKQLDTIADIEFKLNKIKEKDK